MNKLIAICLQTLFLVVQSADSAHRSEGNLLESYLPATMQALAYYIDLLQYEPIATTTVEPPFFAPEDTQPTTPTNSAPITTTTTTTRKPTSSWFESPSWWSSTTTTQASGSTTTTIKPHPTHIHRPALFAPFSSDTLYANQGINNKKKKEPEQTDEPVDVKFPFYSDASFIQWLKRQKPRDDIFNQDIDNNVLDLLPLSLTRDIATEQDEQNKKSGLENLDNFLQIYDDGYGKYRIQSPSTGKKRIPPTKAYVEFLLLYDLLKRDAKAANLNKFEGYTEKMIEELHELSSASAQRQMYTLFKRMLDRKEVQRSDVVTRVKNMIKELGDGKSVVSKSLMYFPPLQFVP